VEKIDIFNFGDKLRRISRDTIRKQFEKEVVNLKNLILNFKTFYSELIK
jgi:hypothetical protein